MTVYVTGEALIDFVPRKDENGDLAFIPKPGGSPYNVALAAARTECKTYFLGNFSNDLFGDLLLNHLKDNKVDCSLSVRSDLPTTLAFVSYEKGEPKYAFVNENSTNRNLNPVLDRDSIPAGSFLHVGSISLIDSPVSERIVSLAKNMSDKMILTLDPNVRANLISDKGKWLQTMGKLFDLASIIKLSNEDLEYFASDLTPEQFANKLIKQRNKMIIVTSGSSECQVFVRDHHISLPVPKVEVMDTVGGGDTLMGTTLSWLAKKGLSNKEMLTHLDEKQLVKMLRYCTIAAGINCTRSGCNPPYSEEIEAKCEF